MMIEYENLSKANHPYLKELKHSFEMVLRSGRFILGDSVKAFESDFAQYNNVKYCSGVASGLDALSLSLMSLASTIHSAEDINQVVEVLNKF